MTRRKPESPESKVIDKHEIAIRWYGTDKR